MQYPQLLIIEYPLKAEFSKFLSFLFICFVSVFLVFIVLFTVGSTGYEYIPIRSIDFNASVSLWYERLIHDVSWVPKTRTCDPAVIKPNESFYILLEFFY